MRILTAAGRTTAVVLMLVAALGVARAQPQMPAMVPRAGLPPLRDVSATQYREHLDRLRRLVADCGRLITACDAAAVGDDDRVATPDGTKVVERFGWLRSLLDDSNDPTHQLRAELLPRAGERLVEQQAEMDALPKAAALAAEQRRARDGVLARKEFRTAEAEYSLTERIGAWISRQISKLFGGVSKLGRMAPWLGTALQWGTLMLALSLLVLWVLRALDRQRIALGRLGGDAARAQADAESRAWANLARTHASKAEWRDAVHCLYWASIVALEDRRTLRRSGTRTPREALQLIDPASHLREPLRAQTGAFERIWYGQQAAAESDYNEALEHYSVLHPAGREARA
ncbi:hypothetical protein Terro_1004 [Terriglobus roseus DSM 18391]|uniref:Protein-glutamine gamma-glutamyltransferase-like C-terminal domain-containing protein n=1 Tax=Terriglobus roseus (strain DSM 18391 / NRRL B-41598 / KBS 63) TaxID=926566 RepID=I3ZDK7_TERRK|nr:DUF4129 domain-containing protein [Terriglobus roseus]AFL87325.1 hypothetical protein Terro_1004 [Terriglobus roseus DSM 18391]